MTFFSRRPHQNDVLIARRCCDVNWVFVEISDFWLKIGGFSLIFWIFVENGWLAGWFEGACRTKTYFLLNTVLAHRLCTRIWVVYSSDPTGAPKVILK